VAEDAKVPVGAKTIVLPRKDGYTEVQGGEMQVRIGHDRDGVWIDFGKNVSAFKLNPDQALAFAQKIHENAIAAKIGV
jgi:hypothetical protein